jgi:hypothetical protein
MEDIKYPRDRWHEVREGRLVEESKGKLKVKIADRLPHLTQD